jgi:hypothetical protein
MRIDLALSHIVSGWLRKFASEELTTAHLDPEKFASQLDLLFIKRKLTSIAQQKNPRSNLVQALKAIDPDHPAISFVSLTSEQYRELNDLQRGRLADRSTKFISAQNVELLVERATKLLTSDDWAEVGAGLAVLVGRRISEILLSNFSPRTAWSLTFSEGSKKDEWATGLEIEIPTLTSADFCLDAIARLQAALKIDDLKTQSITAKAAKRAINERYSSTISTRVDEHFGGLVPTREDRDGLYSHIFRAVYATIAAHWFCPPTVPEATYKAEIQGHFTIDANGRKLPNYSARANYDDYAIGTEDGNRDGRLGIKLGLLPGLQIIEAFAHHHQEKQMSATTIDDSEELIETQTLAEEATPVNQPGKTKTKRPELLASDLTKMAEIVARRGIVGTTAMQFSALLQAFEKLEELEEQANLAQPAASTPSTDSEMIRWFQTEIDHLRTENRTLSQERDRLQQQSLEVQSLKTLQAENEQLKERLATIQSALGLAQPAQPSPVEETRPVESRPVTISSVPPTSRPRTQRLTSPRRTEKNRETEEKINEILNALMSWNDSQSDPDRKIRISIPSIKSLATLVRASNQPKIVEALNTRADELVEHHSKHMLGERHNRKPHSELALQEMARDRLGLENWEELRL